MKKSSRNGKLFFLVLIITIIGYSLIHLYCRGLRDDISNGTTVYENNKKHQPVNNIIAINKTKPTITPTPAPTVEPTNEPTSWPTTKPTNNPTPTPTVKPEDTQEEEINKNIIFEYYYEQGNYIYLINQFPTIDEIGKSLQGEKRTQDFKLKFNADAVGVKYTITVEKLDGSNLDDEWVKMFLVNDGGDVKNCYRSNNRVKTFNEYSKYNNNSKERVIYQGTISSAEASRGYKDFTFRMWVSEDLVLNNSDYLSQTRTYKARINVHATE